MAKPIEPGEFRCPDCGKRFKLQEGMASRKGRCPCGAVLRLPGPEGNGPRVIRRVSREHGKVDLCPQCLEPLNGHVSELIHGMRWCTPCALAYYEGKYLRLAAAAEVASPDQADSQCPAPSVAEPAAETAGQSELSAGQGDAQAPAALSHNTSMAAIEEGPAETWVDGTGVDGTDEAQSDAAVSLWQVRPLEGLTGPAVAPRGKPRACFLPVRPAPSAKAGRHRLLVTIALGALLVILLLVGLVAGLRVTPG